MLGHAPAAMTLDVNADLFDDDRGRCFGCLDHALRPRLCPNRVYIIRIARPEVQRPIGNTGIATASRWTRRRESNPQRDRV